MWRANDMIYSSNIWSLYNCNDFKPCRRSFYILGLYDFTCLLWHDILMYVYLCNTGPDVNEVIKQPKGGPLISYSLYVGSTIGLTNCSMYVPMHLISNLKLHIFYDTIITKDTWSNPSVLRSILQFRHKRNRPRSSGALFQNSDLYFSMQVPILCQPCRFVYLIRNIPVLYVKGC